MDQYINTAYEVTTQLFGPTSGVPWWGWMFVLIALFWKVLIPDTKTANEAAEDRNGAMLAEMSGADGGGKKGKGRKK
jgi:hypothetical protein